MERFTNLLRVAWEINYKKMACGSYVPHRSATKNKPKFDSGFELVRPKRKPVYHPENSGDLAPMVFPKENSIGLLYQNSDTLKNASEDVKKIFSLNYLPRKQAYKLYEKEMVDKVRRHPLDDRSHEVQIAKMTAKIRYMQTFIDKESKKRKLRTYLKELIDARRKFLKHLRNWDYKKFEWILETLELEFRPLVNHCQPVTRKNSLMLLAKLKMENEKEAKLANLKKLLDEQKVPFLEKKLEKLKWIKEEETKNGFTPTVTNKDIEECAQRLDKVKLEVAERQKRGYLRTVHPYSLEVYDEALLKQKEKEGTAMT